MTTVEPGRGGGRRAARVAATRRRILEATLHLHTTLGPARTTVSAIAERAGVQRHTVYAHFPDDTALFSACSGLWQERNPFPDVAAWAAEPDAGARLDRALRELYAYYGRSGADLALVLGDADRVPFMAAQAAAMDEGLGAMAAVLLEGRRLRGRRRARAEAAVRHALALATWRSLVPGGGLSPDEAVALMTALVEAAAAPMPSRRSPRPRSGPSAGGSAPGEAGPTSSTARAAP